MNSSAQEQPVKKPVFDPTINLGHVMTFIVLIASGFALWSQMDKRVVVLEQGAIQQERRSTEQDTRIKESVSEIKTDMREVRRVIEDLNRRR